MCRWTADLLPGVDHGRGDARVGRRHAGGAVFIDGDITSRAGGGEQQAGRTSGGVAGVHADPGQPGQAGRGGEHARCDEEPGADAGQQHDVGQVGADDDRRDHGQEGDAGRHRAEAQGLLQVVGEEQEDAEHAGAGDEDRQVGRGPVAVCDDPQWQQRLAGPRLDEAERGQ